MNKSEFIALLASSFGGNQAEAGRALNAVVEAITSEVAAGRPVTITAFGKFESVVRKGRHVRNPGTGEQTWVEAAPVPKFRAGTQFKRIVAASGAKPQA